MGTFESPLLLSLGLFPLFSTDRHSRVLKLPCTVPLFSLSGVLEWEEGVSNLVHVPEITWPGTRASLEAFEKVKGAGRLSGDRHGQVSPWFPSSFLPVNLIDPPPHPSLLPPSQPHNCLQKPEKVPISRSAVGHGPHSGSGPPLPQCWAGAFVFCFVFS